jgi:hypothetical protein
MTSGENQADCYLSRISGMLRHVNTVVVHINDNLCQKYISNFIRNTAKSTMKRIEKTHLHKIIIFLNDSRVSPFREINFEQVEHNFLIND